MRYPLTWPKTVQISEENKIKEDIAYEAGCTKPLQILGNKTEFPSFFSIYQKKCHVGLEMSTKSFMFIFRYPHFTSFSLNASVKE